MHKVEKTAVLIGATGLVGSHLLTLLLNDDRYSKLKVFHRRTTGIEHPKLEEEIINFKEIRIWKHLITGDELYSTLGTTLKAAGSKEAQYEVDYELQLDLAKIGFKNGVKRYALVSSMGATRSTKNFYLNMKGKLDKKVKKIGFDKLVIVRPSLLTGKRREKRLGEVLSEPLLDVVTRMPYLKKYKPIRASDVAKALINGMNSNSDKIIYEGNEVFELSTSNKKF